MKPKILVLSASTGNGHMSAARAIVDEATARGLQAVCVDVLDFCPVGFQSWYRGGYEKLVRKWPKMWGYLYKTSDRPLFNYGFQTMLDWVFCAGIQRAIEQHNPDWVVCTHSLPQPRLASLRKKHKFKVSVVVTDLYVHRMWLRGKPDWFFVPQDWSKEVLEKRKRRTKGKNSVVGIPIHPVFQNPLEQSQARQKLGISTEEPMVLVSSGGIGGGPVVQTVTALTDTGAMVHVVAGRNTELESQLRTEFGGNQQVTVYGHVDQTTMADLMAAADLLVAKPGGLTTFENLAAGLPFVVYWPFLIPGQEEGNAEFLESEGAGVVCHDIGELVKEVTSLTSDPERMKTMGERATDLSMPQSVTNIVDELVRLSQEAAS